MLDNNIKILDQLTAVNLNVSIWTARKKLTTEDFGGVELPPEELASLGSKKICDPESLRIFSTLKARAVSQLDRIGIRFLGGWAIPDEKTTFIYDRLLEVKNEFLLAKEDFLNNYDLSVKSWVDKHPGWESLIADSCVSAEQVRNRLSFNWQFYKVVPPEQSFVQDSLKNEVDSLGTTLFSEIAKDAQSVWQKVYLGKTEISHKALSPLNAIKNKLLGLSFVEPTAAPIAAIIEEVIVSVPKRGLIKGQHLLTLQGLVSILKDPSLMLEYGQKALNGQTTSSVFSMQSDTKISLNTFLEIDDLEESESKNESAPFDLTTQSDKDAYDFKEDFDTDDLGEDDDLDENDNGVSHEPISSSNGDKSNQKDKQNQDVPFVDSLGLW
jgi:hypothetical protein